MSLSKRRDFGVRVAGDKGRYPDEFVTKKQIVQGQNITITHLNNFDIMISAATGSGGGGNGIGDGYERIRDLYVELRLVRPFVTNKTHFDINDEASNSADNQKYFGTHVFAEIRHNWELTRPDLFQYSVVDTRFAASPAPKTRVNSLPRVIGINGNKIRIIGTDTDEDTRYNPTNWVDTETVNNTLVMKNTRLLGFDGTTPNSGMDNLWTPTYRIRITEVRDYEFERFSKAQDESEYQHDTTYQGM